jgi:hypothetical protein
MFNGTLELDPEIFRPELIFKRGDQKKMSQGNFNFQYNSKIKLLSTK